MKMHRILRCMLCVVWVTSVFGQRKVMLNVTYHKAPSTAYNGRPIQGVCSRGEGPWFLFLTILREKKPDFIIDIRRIPNGKQQNLDLISAGIRMSILARKGPWGQKVWFKLCITSDFEGTEILCELQRSEQERIAYAVSAMTFKNIPTRPAVSMEVHVKPNVLFEWNALKLKCKAVVDRRGHLGYKLTTLAGRTYYWNITWASNDVARETGGLYAHLIFKKTSITSTKPYIDTRLLMRVRESLDGGVFSCYASDLPPDELDISKGIRKEVTLKAVTVKKPYPYTPYLSIYSFRKPDESGQPTWNLKGACVTKVEDDSSRMITILLRTNTDIRAYIGNMSVQTRELKIVKLKKTVDYHDTPLLSFDADFTYPGTVKVLALQVKFTAKLKTSAEFAVISCRTKDLMKCEMLHPGHSPSFLKDGASSTIQNIEKDSHVTKGLSTSKASDFNGFRSPAFPVSLRLPLYGYSRDGILFLAEYTTYPPPPPPDNDCLHRLLLAKLQ